MEPQEPNQAKEFFGDMSERAFAEVRERFPVGPDTPHRVNRNGDVVNMTREAMLARVEGFRRRFTEEVSGHG